MKPIETIYCGYRFRSRLEARWAVFLDTLGVSYQYEKEGYDLDGVWYLPDFWLPNWDKWMEIKSEYPTGDEIERCYRLTQVTKKECIVLWGEPWVMFSYNKEGKDYWNYRYRFARIYPDYKSDFSQHLSNIFSECRYCSAISCLIPWSKGSSLDNGQALESIANFAGFGPMEHCCVLPEIVSFPHADINLLPRLKAAYTEARQARFEFGEKGRR